MSQICPILDARSFGPNIYPSIYGFFTIFSNSFTASICSICISLNVPFKLSFTNSGSDSNPHFIAPIGPNPLFPCGGYIHISVTRFASSALCIMGNSTADTPASKTFLVNVLSISGSLTSAGVPAASQYFTRSYTLSVPYDGCSAHIKTKSYPAPPIIVATSLLPKKVCVPNRFSPRSNFSLNSFCIFRTPPNGFFRPPVFRTNPETERPVLCNKHTSFRRDFRRKHIFCRR